MVRRRSRTVVGPVRSHRGRRAGALPVLGTPVVTGYDEAAARRYLEGTAQTGNPTVREHNSAMVWLGAVADLIADPSSTMTPVSASGDTPAHIVERLSVDRQGRTTVGATLARGQLGLANLGETPPDDRRAMVRGMIAWALQRQGTHRATVTAEQTAGFNPLLVIIPVAVVAAVAVVAISLYHAAVDTARVSEDQAIRLATIQVGQVADLYRQRLAEWRQTGTMPPASPAEDQGIADLGAHAQEVQTSDAGSTERTISTAGKYALAVVGAFLLFQLIKGSSRASE